MLRIFFEKDSGQGILVEVNIVPFLSIPLSTR